MSVFKSPEPKKVVQKCLPLCVEPMLASTKNARPIFFQIYVNLTFRLE